MKPDIVYEDKDIIICNKPVGTSSQSERSFETDLLSEVRTYFAEMSGKNDAYIINRLDKPVGGLVLFALNKKMAAALSAMSAAHSVEKNYYAVVCGTAENKGCYTDWLCKDARGNFSRVVPQNTEGAKKAELEYERIDLREIDGAVYSLVGIRLHTGRHHQIRVQFAAHGHPIYGDTKYNPDFSGQKGVFPALFAYRLAFDKPHQTDRIDVAIHPSGGVWDMFRI